MGFVGAIVGIMVAVIVLVAVAIPTIANTLFNLSSTGRVWNGTDWAGEPTLTGTTLLVTGLLPLLLALAGILIVTKLYA